MQRASRTARKTGGDISKSLESARRTAVTAFRGIAAAAGVVGVVGAASVFARYVDAAKQLEAQLRLATRESGTFAQAQSDVQRIAQASRSDISAVADLYATLQRNSRELNITQAESARLTETITKAFQISGATAEEAAGGLRQFLQGLQSGTLRGEELNSVLENAPRLARALADGLGVTIGQLRAMGAAGQLTGQQVTQAILSASSSIDDEFRQIPVTFDQAMTQVRNAATVAFGAFDRGGDFSNALINFAGTGEMSFGQIEQAAFDTGREIRAVFDGLANVFDPMGEGAANVFDYIRREAAALSESIATDLMAAQRAANDIQNVLGARFDFRSGSIVYPEPFTFAERFRAGADPTRQNAGIIDAFMAQMPGGARNRSARPAARPPRLSGGGGGGGRRRSFGGGGSRARAETPLRRTGDLQGPADWFYGEPISEDEARQLREDVALVARLREGLGSLDDIQVNLPDLGEMLRREDEERIRDFMTDFRHDLAGSLAEAIVGGRNLGDALVDAFRRAAAALLESGINDLLSGRGFGGGGGGGFFSSLFRVIGSGGGGSSGLLDAAMNLAPGAFASGGSFTVGGRSGIDRNVLSLNGTPVARVSQGETVGVGWGGGGSRVQVVPSPYFDVVVDGRVISTGSPMVAAGMTEARAGAQLDLRRQAARRIP